MTCKASFDEVKQNVEVKERTKRPRKYADEAEKAAQHALDTDVVSFETLQHVLDQMDIPSSDKRKNVIPRGQKEVKGMLFGLYSYGGAFGVSAATKKYPFVTKLLVAAMRAHDPNFPFTSVQLNHCYG